VVHAANTVTHIVASDGESFSHEMACDAVSEQEGWNCTVGQKVYGILWIAYWLIFGLKWEP
jgi:hypothetical protein